MTYSNYETPDAVARAWLASLRAHRSIVRQAFAKHATGELPIRQLQIICEMTISGPVSDQDLEEVTREFADFQKSTESR